MSDKRRSYMEVDEHVRQGLLEAVPVLAAKRGWKMEELEEFAWICFDAPLKDCSSRELAAMVAHFRDYHTTAKAEGES